MQTNIIASLHDKNQETTVHTAQVIELGTATKLTLGAERGWFECGRPGHDPKRIGK